MFRLPQKKIAAWAAEHGCTAEKFNPLSIVSICKEQGNPVFLIHPCGKYLAVDATVDGWDKSLAKKFAKDFKCIFLDDRRCLTIPELLAEQPWVAKK